MSSMFGNPGKEIRVDSVQRSNNHYLQNENHYCGYDLKLTTEKCLLMSQMHPLFSHRLLVGFPRLAIRKLQFADVRAHMEKLKIIPVDQSKVLLTPFGVSNRLELHIKCVIVILSAFYISTEVALSYFEWIKIETVCV